MRRTILLFLAFAACIAQQTGEDPGHRVINYEVDGSAYSAFLTYRDEAGKTRQKYVKLPYEEQFFAPYGAFIYLSGQKQQPSGKLHVLIRVGGVPFRESETDKAYGIATASGAVPK